MHRFFKQYKKETPHQVEREALLVRGWWLVPGRRELETLDSVGAGIELAGGAEARVRRRRLLAEEA